MGVKCVYTIKPSPETRVALGVLVKRIAQHVVACNPLTLDTTTPSSTTIKKESDEDIDDEITPTALLDQDYFFGGGSVRQVLQSGSPAVPAGVGFEIVSFRRFEVGEFLENEESSTEEKK